MNAEQLAEAIRRLCDDSGLANHEWSELLQELSSDYEMLAADED